MNVIIDTNCLIASIPPKNPEYWLYRAFRDKVLNILLIASNVIRSEPFIHWRLINDDPDDNKFADLAISANAQYLVTNDHHFNILKTLPFPTVQVVSLSEFQEILGY
ncbi:MAG: PIN domain-containing protein [Saprospiraceae bacterium]|nr:PIN domain-containing protein [Saprospiraceae bacterium]